jgi:hypothetical protein
MTSIPTVLRTRGMPQYLDKKGMAIRQLGEIIVGNGLPHTKVLQRIK